jgi:hypothetical protein
MTRRIYKVKSRMVSSTGVPHSASGTFAIDDNGLSVEVEFSGVAPARAFSYRIQLAGVESGHYRGTANRVFDSRFPDYHPSLHLDIVVDEGGVFEGIWQENAGNPQQWVGTLGK